ncbi:MAG: hypothetical protein QX197_15755 [Methylococcaceae bacterium]
MALPVTFVSAVSSDTFSALIMSIIASGINIATHGFAIVPTPERHCH